jgi:hypothetical protein
MACSVFMISMTAALRAVVTSALLAVPTADVAWAALERCVTGVVP